MPGRVYTIPLDSISVPTSPAPRDLFYVPATSTVPFELHEITLGQKTLTAWEAKEMRLMRLTGTLTAGTGGASITPVPNMPGDVAAVTTARGNDATTTASGGTANTIIKPLMWEFLNGFYWSPAGEDDRIRLAPSTALVLRLVTGPSGTMTVSGSMVISELV